MKWLTNVHEDDRLIIHEITNNKLPHVIIVGKPRSRPSSIYSVDDLEAMGLVGIYDRDDCEW